MTKTDKWAPYWDLYPHRRMVAEKIAEQATGTTLNSASSAAKIADFCAMARS